MKQFSVLLRVRNEGPYLIEWIAHYLALGFDDILIVHNENDDGSTALLELLHKEGICRVHESRKSAAEDELTPGQRAVQLVKDQGLLADSKWLFTVDADELLILRQHESLAEFLGRHDDSDQVIISWDLFIPDPESARFDGEFEMRRRFAHTIGDYSHIKSISRVDRFPERIAPHRIISNTGKTTLADGSVILPGDLKLKNWKSEFDQATEQLLEKSKSAASLYHYRFKSATEFCMRRARGVAGPHALKNNGLLFVGAMLDGSGKTRKIDPQAGYPDFDSCATRARSLLAVPGVSDLQEEIEQRYLEQAHDIEAGSLTYRFISDYLNHPDNFSVTRQSLQLLEQHPDSSELLWLAAYCHRYAEDYERAHELSLQALKRSPEHAAQQRYFVENMEKAARLRKLEAGGNGPPPPGGKGRARMEPDKRPGKKGLRRSLSKLTSRLLGGD